MSMTSVPPLLTLLPPHVNVVATLAAVAWRARRRGPVSERDSELLELMRDGDQDAFLELVARHQPSMMRLARSFVSSSAVAEEVVQDTWIGMLRGVDRFAGRSSFKTWLLAILVNRARSTGVIEHRSVAIGDAGPAVDRARFDATGGWMAPPQHWVEDSHDRLHAESLSEHLRVALQELPGRQREVVLLRDVDGLTSDEVCQVLDISEGNQRVLLHRGRSRLRAALESEIGGML
jgi:RNA polymerase sigma-70 factor (ECF subfamily)